MADYSKALIGKCTEEERQRVFAHLDRMDPTARTNYLKMCTLDTAGKIRELADFLKQCVSKTTFDDEWSFMYLQEYVHCFKSTVLFKRYGKHEPCLKKDFDFFRRLVRRDNVPAVHRMEVAFGLGMIYTSICDVQQSADYYRKCIDIVTLASEEERQRRIRNSTFGAQHEFFINSFPAGIRMDSMKIYAEHNLAQTVTTDSHTREEQIRAAQALEARRQQVVVDGKQVKLDKARAVFERDRGFHPKGEKCDNCMAPRPVGKRLLRCGLCERAHYCSKQCQQAHWKSEHKTVCKQRKKDEFLVGDYCMIKGLVAKPELNGLSVAVLGKAEKEGRWIVQPRLGNSISIKGENLVLSTGATNLTQQENQNT